jgi:hypothetical protein
MRAETMLLSPLFPPSSHCPTRTAPPQARSSPTVPDRDGRVTAMVVYRFCSAPCCAATIAEGAPNPHRGAIQGIERTEADRFESSFFSPARGPAPPEERQRSKLKFIYPSGGNLATNRQPSSGTLRTARYKRALLLLQMAVSKAPTMIYRIIKLLFTNWCARPLGMSRARRERWHRPQEPEIHRVDP